MSIDELIKEMEKEYATFLEGTGLDDPEYMKEERKNNPDCDLVCTANEMTIGILCKYQKIEKIFGDRMTMDNPFGDSYTTTFHKLKEVLEDVD